MLPTTKAMRCSPGRDTQRPLTIMVNGGSGNSRGKGRANTTAFLQLGNACPLGYVPDKRMLFAYLPGVSDMRFIVGRPQNAPLLAARGYIDAFISFSDVVLEAEEAGLQGVEKLLDLPFVAVDVVLAAGENAPFSSLGDLVAQAPCPIECLADLPFLARRAFREEKAYRARFGVVPPAIEMHGATIADGCRRLRITASAGSSEQVVALGAFSCCAVVRSTGETIEACRLKILKSLGRFCPGFFCRRSIRDDPRLLRILEDYRDRLELAKSRWQNLRACRQLKLPFQAA